VHSLLLVGWTHCVVQLSHLVDCYPLPIFAILSPNITSLRLIRFTHFIVAAPHSIPHSRIFRPRQYSSAIVIERIIIHVLKLISLSQPIPGSEILGVDLNSIAVGLNGSRYIFHLEILMTHESPGSQTSPIKFERFSKINDSL